MLYLITGDPKSIDQASEALKALDPLSLQGDILIKFDGTSLELLLKMGAIKEEKDINTVNRDWKQSRILIIGLDGSTIINGLQDNSMWERIDNDRR